MRTAHILFAAAFGALVSGALIAHAQDANTEKAIEKYRQMLKEDPWSNPGLLDADRRGSAGTRGDVRDEPPGEQAVGPVGS